MSAIPLQEDDFVYPTSSPKGTGPLRLLTFETFATNTVLSLLLVDAKKDGEFFAISYAWDPLVCKPCFGVNGDTSCATHGTALWTNNKALCNAYLSNDRSESDGYRGILIDGNEFYIQDTVYYLLLTIQRHLQKGDYFWLDAICINQNDNLERERETSNMHEIYKAAQHVYVWLGTEHDNSNAAMDFLYRLVELAPPTWERFLESESCNYRPVQSHSQDLSHEIQCLFDRPYWKRTWVIQEFLLAKDLTLLCGNRAVPWTKAEYLVDRLASDAEFRIRRPSWNAMPGVKIIQARKAFRSFPRKLALEDMIHHFLFSRSTYPEDKLIGLLNVSLSNADTNFIGMPGSIEKRVGVIKEIVRDIQDRDLNPDAGQAWRYLLACLLGVPQEFPDPGRTSLFPEMGFNAALSPRRHGLVAISAPFAARVGSPKVSRWQYSSTDVQMPVVGNVRPPEPDYRTGAGQRWDTQPLPRRPSPNGTRRRPQRPVFSP